MVMKLMYLVTILLIIMKSSHQVPSCSYGARGSLTSTCVEAGSNYFRTTNYRFDNLDETVQCINCNLATIESNSFDISGNQIKKLNLTNSKIITLKPKSFMGLVFMETLLMPCNKIVSIPENTFLGINKLSYLDLQNNSITSLVQNGFRELVNLKTLNLKSNMIKTIQVGSFNGLASLETLDLTNNNIETMKDIFNNLSSITVILLENNNILQLTPNDTIPLYSLVELNLAGNNLKTLKSATFLHYPNLESLNLTRNLISSLSPGAFRGLYSLDYLDLSHCAINEIEKGVFQYLRQLRLLELSYNGITSFNPGIYTSLPELRILNVSHNSISTLYEPGIFKINNLHTLDLSYNSLQDLDYKLLVDYLPSLSKIELNNNKWPCYLGQEMEKYFKYDNLIFNLGAEYENVKCNSTRLSSNVKPLIPKLPEDHDDTSPPKTAQLVQESNGHEYVLYIFIFLSTGVTIFLFYLQYKTQKEIKQILGHSNISEVHLLSAQDE